MIGREEFEQIVSEAIVKLPEVYRKKMENIAVFVQDFPDQSMIKSMNLSTPYALLGIYQGVPLPRRGIYYGNVMPDRIILFRKPILKKSQSKKEICQEINRVIYHEIGHYFGLKEPELYQIEREKKKKKDKKI